MKIKFEPEADITALEVALILKNIVPFCGYSAVPPDVWEKMRYEGTQRHFVIEEEK